MNPKLTLILSLLLLTSVIKGQSIIFPGKENLKGKVKSYTEYTYEAIEHNGNKVKGKQTITALEYPVQKIYDENGNLIEQNRYKSDGGLFTKYTYKYDENGNPIEENLFVSEGILERKRTFKFRYDKNKNPIEENYYNSDDSLIMRNTYLYD